MRIENIEDVRVLVETARGGTLTAAARVLEITPAAASAMLKRLEAQTGARLFERSTRAMRLTEQGQTLLDYATRALDLLEEGQAQLSQQGGALVGTVRVAASSDLSRSVLLPWLDEFLKAHPGVQLQLSVGDRVQDVTRDAVDVALRYGDPDAAPDSSLVARRLALARRMCCAAPAYLRRHGTPKTPQDLAQHNCLTLHIGGRREVQWRFERGEGRARETLDVRVDGDRGANDGAIGHDWALAGAGIVYKSGIDIAAHMKSGALVPLLPQWQGQRYALNAILPSNRFVPARVRALVDFLAARFAAFEIPGSVPARRTKMRA